VNEAPYNFQVSSTAIDENNTPNAVIGDLTVQDEDIGDVVTISFAGSNTEQATFFSIVNNQLLALPAFNFEVRSTYPVDLIATDVQGLSVALSFTVTIGNVNEPPTDLQLSNQSIAENVAAGAVIGNLSTIDEDFNETHAYTFVSGAGDTDNASFIIDQGSLKNAQVFNFEVKSTYSIRLRTTDSGGAFFEKSYVISVLDVNEAPYNFQVSNTSIDENNASNAVIGDLTVEDEDIGDVVTISFAGSNTEQATFFSIVNNQLLALPSFNFELRSTYPVDLIATDVQGLSVALSFTVTVTDVNEAPTNVTASNQSIAENEEIGTIVGSFSTIDEDFNETHTYTLVAGEGDTDNALFMIDQHVLKAAETFNFENKSAYTIRVRTTDKGNLTFEKSFAISINDVNEVPFDLALSASEIAENLPVGTVIGNLTAQDEDFDDVVTFTLNPANTSQLANFSIVNNQLVSAASFNFEQTSSYSIDVVATDLGGLSAEMSYDITVLNVNEAPYDLSFSAESFLEEQAIGTEIGLFSALDEDANDTQTYAFVNTGGANDNASFDLVGNRLLSKEVYKYRLKSSYTFEVSVTDSQGASMARVFNLAINELPIPTLPSIDIVTPNGDGINDTWFIQDVERFYNFSVSIYDTNGQLMYFLKDNYDNSWNGQIKGRNLPTGAYFYVLKNNTTGKTYSGTISLFN
jgi:gliding motility-associated-like protein